MRYREILFEVDFFDRSPLVDVLNKHRGRYIHFTNVTKIGVNPKKFHRDPFAVFFYPVDWLLSGTERVREGRQYGLNMNYYFVVEINKYLPGFTLSKMTWNDVETIAKRNGWHDHYLAFKADPQASGLPSFANLNMPGSVFWHLLDRLQKDGKLTWNAALKGIAWIEDDNNGIIFNYEPDQMMVLDPRAIKIVDFGENPAHLATPAEKPQDWNSVLKKVFGQIVAKFGGKISYKNKMIRYNLTKDDKTISIRFSDSSWSPNLTVEYTYGRAKGYDTIGVDQLNIMSLSEIAEKLSHVIEGVFSRTSDILFEPHVSEAEIARIVNEKVAKPLQWTVETEITNPDDFVNRKRSQRSQLWQTFEVKRDIDEILLTTRVIVQATEEGMSVTCQIGFDDNSPIINLSQIGTFPRSDLDNLMFNYARAFSDEIETRSSMIGPKASGTSWRLDGVDEDEWPAAKGWFAQNCGLTLDGNLESVMADEIAAYRAFEDKVSLHSRIHRSLLALHRKL